MFSAKPSCWSWALNVPQQVPKSNAPHNVKLKSIIVANGQKSTFLVNSLLHVEKKNW